MTQAGGAIRLNEAGGDYYDIFQSAESDANGEYHKYISVLPQNIGSNADNYNDTGRKFTFVIPEGIYDMTTSYFTVEATLYNKGSGDGVAVGEYDITDKTTHVTIQNGACSFFTTAEMLHNANQVEQINSPAMCEMVDALCNSGTLAKGAGETNFMYLERCPTFEAAGGSQYTGTATGTAAPYNVITRLNTTTYDPSFEKRCRITGNGPFQISGKLPFSLFKYRTCATYLANASVELTRAPDNEIIEDRSGVTSNNPYVTINKLTLWMHSVRPALAVQASILEGVKNGEPQTIGGRRWQYTGKDLPASLLEPNFQQTLTNRPSKIFVGFRTKTQKSRRTWNSNNIANVSVRLGDRIINEQTLNVKSWNTKANETRAVYEHFIAATGQGGIYGDPSITYEQFASNYVLWAFDTSPSSTGALVLAKEPIEMNIDARVIDTGSNVPLTMDIFVCYDGAYSIAGPAGMPTKLY